MKKSSLLLVLMLLLSSCHKIPKEVRRSSLYKEVIAHYDKQDVSSEKCKAALFLFEHIASHYSYVNESEKYAMDTCIASFLDSYCATDGDIHKLGPQYVNLNYKAISRKTELKLDIEQLSSKYLINHIDAAFSAWRRMSQVADIDFDIFCNYILPYRVTQEPIEQDFKLGFSDKYTCVIDSLIDGASFEPVVQHIIQNENIFLKRNGFLYPYSFSIKQIYNLKSVKSCDDAAIYFAILFRSLGIPATVDITKRSYRNNGHTLLALYWEKRWYSFEVPDGTITLRDPERSMQNFPKVNRLAYANAVNHNDVSHEYSPTIDFLFKKKLWDKGEQAIALFNNEIGLDVIATSKRVSLRRVKIDNMGIDCIYALGSNDKNGFNADSVVYVDTLGHVHRLKADYQNRKQLVLNRKYLMDKRQFVSKMPRIESMNGICLEGFNALDASQRDTLITVSGFSKPYLFEFPLEGKKKYKFLQVSKLGFRTFIAECEFYDEQHHPLLTETINYNTLADFRDKILDGNFPDKNTLLTNGAVKNPNKIFDKNELSYGALGAAGKLLLYAPKGVVPSAFAIQARNDQNHIVIGDTYELMMWDDGWQPLGEKVAKSHELIYEDVPSNALYWLRNLSRGKEEYPFIMNEQGEQYWAGQANF